MRYSLILVLQFVFAANIFSLEIDTLRLQLENSVCYADNIVEKPVKNSSGVIIYPNPNHGIINIEFDDLELELIDVGADDIQKEDEGITVITKIEDLQKVKKFFDDKNIATESAEIEYVAKEIIEAEDKEKIKKFIEELEDNEDVADYYMNVNI